MQHKTISCLTFYRWCNLCYIPISNAFCQLTNPSRGMVRLRSTVACVWSCFFVSALELCSFPMRVRKPDWKLFLSAAHHQLLPGCSHRSTLATCSISPLNVNTLNPSVSCTSQWQVFLCSGMCTGMNAVWLCVFSVFFICTAIKLWDGMSGLDIKDSFQFDDFVYSVPTGGQHVMRFVVKTLRSSFYCIPVQAACSPNNINYSSKKKYFARAKTDNSLISSISCRIFSSSWEFLHS